MWIYVHGISTRRIEALLLYPVTTHHKEIQFERRTPMRWKYITLQPLRSILFVISFTVLSIWIGNSLSEIGKYWSIVASCINVLVIIILIAIAKSSKSNYFEMINYKKGKTKISSICYMSLIMVVIGMAGMYLTGFVIYNEFPYLAKSMIEPIPLHLAVINVLVLPITTTLAEDGLYLGYGVNKIYNKWLSIIVPAFFYAAQHCFIPTILDWKFILYRFFSFLPLTLYICYWYRKNRNPVPVMIGHIVLNVATAMQIVIASAASIGQR